MDEKTIRENLQEIVDAAGTTKALNYAVAYAKAGLRMSGEELRVQVLYILGNITHWRGEQAKRIRQNLKAFVG